MGIVRIPNGLRTLLRQLGIDANATSIPEIGAESDSASATGSLYAQVNKAQADIGATGDTASASGSLFARAKFNKDAGDALAVRAAALEAGLTTAQTITLTSVIATDKVVVGTTTFTCVASGATGNQFNLGLNDTATAVNLAAKIDALPNITATSDADVVTVTSTVPGVYLAVETSDTTMVVAPAGTVNVMYILNDLLAELDALSARVTAIEET